MGFHVLSLAISEVQVYLQSRKAKPKTIATAKRYAQKRHKQRKRLNQKKRGSSGF